MIPIDVISGFLGAGKTTLASLLLRYYIDRGEKPVYIVNEFGQTTLDADIIRHDGFEAMELVGGCVCCTLKGNATIAVKEIISALSPSRVVFEPSGIFIPDSFYEILKDEALAARCCKGSAITVIDSLSFAKARIVAGNFIHSQIKHAGKLILSKLEKCDVDISELICNLKNINPEAELFAKRWDLLDEDDLKALTEPEDGGHSAGRHHVHHKFQALTFQAEKDFDTARLERLRAAVQSGILGEILRVKGVIRLNGKPVLLNIAFEDVNISPARMAEDFSLTFIGNRLNRVQIQSRL